MKSPATYNLHFFILLSVCTLICSLPATTALCTVASFRLVFTPQKHLFSFPIQLFGAQNPPTVGCVMEDGASQHPMGCCVSQGSHCCQHEGDALT